MTTRTHTSATGTNSMADNAGLNVLPNATAVKHGQQSSAENANKEIAFRMIN